MYKQLKHLSVALIIATVAPAAAALDLPVKTVNGKQYYYYQIQPKETIYSLTNKLGLQRGDIEKYNPSAADGLRSGDTLYFPVSDFGSQTSATTTSTTAQNSVNGQLTYKVTKGETLYSIAKRYNVTTDRLIELNPSVRDGLKTGSVIVIYDGTESQGQAQASATQQKSLRDIPDQTVYPPKQPTIALVEQDNNNTTTANSEKQTNPIHKNGKIDIAVMLPFMLDNTSPGKQANLYTDFYKGLLMAVDTLRSTNTPIHIHAYDTANSASTVNDILARKELKSMDIIIAPDDSTQIEAIASYADKTGASVLNLFAVKNTSYKQHPSLINANIPHEMMYQKAISNFITRFDGYMPVVLVNEDNEGDKKTFIDKLEQQLNNKHIQYKEVTYTGTLRASDLEWIDENEQYVFIPSSGARAELSRLLTTMIDKRNSMSKPDNIRLFGYPEWMVLRGDIAQRLHQMNTVIYSRFVSDPENYRTRRLESRFQEWYGTAMVNTAPMQGTLGFDTGMWILKTLTFTSNETLDSDNFVYHGLQSGFDMTKPQSDGGMVNESLYFINFQTDGELDKIIL